MKVFKRISAMVISLAMIMSCAFSTVAFAADGMTDVTDDNQYYKAIADLVEQGIITGYEDGTFKPEGNITRAEFCAIVARADAPNGYVFAGTNSSFADVAANAQWAIGYVEYAIARKIVNGFEDGTFRPNEPVTYAQALKMIVCALDYGFAAEATDPWYQTYIDLANRLNLTKNAAGSPDVPAVRGLVAQLVYNMNDTAPAVQTGVDESGKPIYEMGDSSKQESNGTSSVEGVLLGVFKDTITGQSEGLSKKEALVMVGDDEEVFVIGDYTVAELTAFLGYEVKITYSEDDSGDNKIEKIRKTSDNEVFVINDIDINSIDDTEIEYFDENDDIEELKIDDLAYAMKNGGAIDLADLTTELDIDSGYITFIDNDGNGTMDVAFIKSYATMYVGNVTKSNGIYTVYDKFNPATKFSFDEDNDDMVIKVAANGADSLTDGNLSSISTSSIISVAVSPTDAEKVEIIVSKKTASGNTSTSEVKRISSDYLNITFGKETFDVSNYYLDNLDSTSYPQVLSVGDACNVYLDFTGKIAAVNKKETSTSYGYITKVGTLSSDMDSEDYVVRMYDASGRYYSALPVATRGFKINGSSKDPSELVEAIETVAEDVVNVGDKGTNNSQAVLVKYEISNNTLKSVYLIDDENIVPKYVDGEALTYNSSSYSFRLDGETEFTISSSTKVFIVPLNRSETDEYRVVTGTGEFTNDVEYIIDAYDADGNSPAKAVVVYGVSSTIQAKADTILVKGVSDEYDEDRGEPIQKLTYYSLNSSGVSEEKTLNAKENDILDDVESGDIIRVFISNGKITKVQTIFAAATPAMNVSGGGADEGSYSSSTGKFTHSLGGHDYLAMYGTVTLRPGEGAGGETIRVSKDGDTENNQEFRIDGNTVIIRYVGDESSNDDIFEFNIAKEEIMDNSIDGVDASKVFVVRYGSDALDGIIIYE